MAEHQNGADTKLESALAEDRRMASESAPAGLEDRVFMATQAHIVAARRRPSVVVRSLRIGLPLACAAGLAIVALTLRSAPTQPGSGELQLALLEEEIDVALSPTAITEDWDDLEAFLSELDELESALALDWSDDLALFEGDFEYEETTQ